MKKLALAAALAATLSTGAQAVMVESDLSNAGLWIATNNKFNGEALKFNDGVAEGNFAVGGDTVTGLTFTGLGIFNGGPDVRVNFDLSGGMRQGDNGVGGTMFTAGTITIDVDAGEGYQQYQIIDVAAEGDLPFLSGQDGHLVSGSQITAGLVVDDAGNGSFTAWNGGFFDPTWNNALSVMTFFGGAAGLFVDGTVSAVPVPAAAWLFGSALVGLAGIGRKRKVA